MKITFHIFFNMRLIKSKQTKKSYCIKVSADEGFYIGVILALWIASNISVVMFGVNFKWMWIFTGSKRRWEMESIQEAIYSPHSFVCFWT